MSMQHPHNDDSKPFVVAMSDRPPSHGEDPAPRSRRVGRLHGALKTVGVVAGTGTTFVVALIGGALVHLGTAPARAVVMSQVNAALAPSFKGKLAIERLGSLGLGGLGGADVRVKDPDGRDVLVAQGLQVKASLIGLGLGALGSGDLVLRIDSITIDHVDVLLEPDGQGAPTIAQAFQPAKDTPDDPNARGVDIRLPDVRLTHAWVHGRGPLPVVDAELNDVRVGARIAPAVTTAEVRSLDAVARAILPLPIHAHVEANATLPKEEMEKTMHADARIRARAGEVRVDADGKADGPRIEGVLDVPRTEPAALRALVPEVPVNDAVSLHATVSGELPTLHPHAEVHLGPGQVTVDGTVVAGKDTRVDAQVHAAGVDTRSLKQDLPRSNLNLDATLAAVLEASGGVHASYDVHTSPATFDGQVIPAVDARGEATKTTVRGTAEVHENGAPTKVAYDLRQTDGPEGMVVGFRTNSRADLGALTRVGKLGKGSAQVVTEGTVSLGTQRVAAEAHAELRGIDAQGVHADRGAVTARVGGSFAAPTVDASVTIDGLVPTDGIRFHRATATARGTPKTMALAADLRGDGETPSIRARATLEAGKATVVRDATVDVTRDDVTMHATVAHLRAEGKTLDMQGVRIEGLGEPIEASVHMDPRDLAATVVAPRVDLARVGRLAKMENQLKGGTASLDAFVGSHNTIPYGEVKLEATGVQVQNLRPAYVSVDAVIDDRKVHSKAVFEMDEVGWANVETRVALQGRINDPAAWKRAVGSMALEARGDLAQLKALLPPDKVPVEAMAGLVNVKASVTRGDAEELPDARVFVGTEGLRVAMLSDDVPNGDGTVTRKKEGFHLEGIDGRAEVTLDGASGFTEFTTGLHDGKGALLFANAKAEIPFAKLLANPEQTRGLLEKVAFASHVEVPQREIEDLPRAVGALPLKGRVAAGINASGTMEKPFVDVGIRGFDLRGVGRKTGTPLNMTARATYDAERASARMMVVRDDRTVVDGYVAATAKLAEIVHAPPGAPLKWEANARIKADRVPLEDLAWATNQRMNGEISGLVSVDHLHVAPAIAARFDLSKVAVGRTPPVNGVVTMSADAQQAKADVRINQPDGHMLAGLVAPITWADATVPTLDETRPLDLTYDLQRFRLGLIAPFVRDVVGALDGRLDGKGDVHIEPGRTKGQFRGSIDLTEGKFHVAALGDEYHSVRARVRVDPWGTVKVEDVSASGLTGRVTANAVAKLEGFTLQNANAQVRIAKNEALPLSFQGVPMGEAYGAIDVKAEGAKDALNVQVDIPTFHFTLPQSVGKSVQELDPEETIRIGRRADGGTFVALPLEASKPEKKKGEDSAPEKALNVSINLGNDVGVERDTTLRLSVTGNPKIEIADDMKVSGQVRVNKGFVEIQGKKFQVERAVVTFADEPSNPVVVATAYYDAPDRTRVYADFRGTPKDGDVTLRSDPPHSKDEILAILLFGNADGALGAAAPPSQRRGGTTRAAVSVGGGFVTQGLNKVLSGVSPYEITTRIGTNESNNPRPELAVQVSKTVSAQVGYNVGLPAPGQNRDRTTFMLDWRFKPKWSMLTTVGNLGSTILDFVWRHRY